MNSALPHSVGLTDRLQSVELNRCYTYYHRQDGCPTRFSADDVNTKFVYELKKYVPKPELLEVYKLVLLESWNDQTNHLQSDRRQLLEQIKQLEGKLANIRDLLSSKQFDPADFRKMKTEDSNKL